MRKTNNVIRGIRSDLNEIYLDAYENGTDEEVESAKELQALWKQTKSVMDFYITKAAVNITSNDNEIMKLAEAEVDMVHQFSLKIKSVDLLEENRDDILQAIEKDAHSLFRGLRRYAKLAAEGGHVTALMNQKYAWLAQATTRLMFMAVHFGAKEQYEQLRELLFAFKKGSIIEYALELQELKKRNIFSLLKYRGREQSLEILLGDTIMTTDTRKRGDVANSLLSTLETYKAWGKDFNSGDKVIPIPNLDYDKLEIRFQFDHQVEIIKQAEQALADHIELNNMKVLEEVTNWQIAGSTYKGQPIIRMTDLGFQETTTYKSLSIFSKNAHNLSVDLENDGLDKLKLSFIAKTTAKYLGTAMTASSGGGLRLLTRAGLLAVADLTNNLVNLKAYVNSIMGSISREEKSLSKVWFGFQGFLFTDENGDFIIDEKTGKPVFDDNTQEGSHYYYKNMFGLASNLGIQVRGINPEYLEDVRKYDIEARKVNLEINRLKKEKQSFFFSAFFLTNLYSQWNNWTKEFNKSGEYGEARYSLKSMVPKDWSQFHQDNGRKSGTEYVPLKGQGKNTHMPLKKGSDYVLPPMVPAIWDALPLGFKNAIFPNGGYNGTVAMTAGQARQLYNLINLMYWRLVRHLSERYTGKNYPDGEWIESERIGNINVVEFVANSIMPMYQEKIGCKKLEDGINNRCVHIFRKAVKKQPWVKSRWDLVNMKKTYFEFNMKKDNTAISYVAKNWTSIEIEGFDYIGDVRRISKDAQYPKRTEIPKLYGCKTSGKSQVMKGQAMPNFFNAVYHADDLCFTNADKVGIKTPADNIEMILMKEAICKGDNKNDLQAFHDEVQNSLVSVIDRSNTEEYADLVYIKKHAPERIKAVTIIMGEAQTLELMVMKFLKPGKVKMSYQSLERAATALSGCMIDGYTPATEESTKDYLKYMEERAEYIEPILELFEGIKLMDGNGNALSPIAKEEKVTQNHTMPADVFRKLLEAFAKLESPTLLNEVKERSMGASEGELSAVLNAMGLDPMSSASVRKKYMESLDKMLQKYCLGGFIQGDYLLMHVSDFLPPDTLMVHAKYRGMYATDEANENGPKDLYMRYPVVSSTSVGKHDTVFSDDSRYRHILIDLGIIDENGEGFPEYALFPEELKSEHQADDDGDEIGRVAEPKVDNFDVDLARAQNEVDDWKAYQSGESKAVPESKSLRKMVDMLAKFAVISMFTLQRQDAERMDIEMEAIQTAEAKKKIKILDENNELTPGFIRWADENQQGPIGLFTHANSVVMAAKAGIFLNIHFAKNSYENQHSIDSAKREYLVIPHIILCRGDVWIHRESDNMVIFNPEIYHIIMKWNEYYTDHEKYMKEILEMEREYGFLPKSVDIIAMMKIGGSEFWNYAPATLLSKMSEYAVPGQYVEYKLFGQTVLIDPNVADANDPTRYTQHHVFESYKIKINEESASWDEAARFRKFSITDFTEYVPVYDDNRNVTHFEWAECPQANNFPAYWSGDEVEDENNRRLRFKASEYTVYPNLSFKYMIRWAMEMLMGGKDKLETFAKYFKKNPKLRQEMKALPVPWKVHIPQPKIPSAMKDNFTNTWFDIKGGEWCTASLDSIKRQIYYNLLSPKLTKPLMVSNALIQNLHGVEAYEAGGKQYKVSMVDFLIGDSHHNFDRQTFKNVDLLDMYNELDKLAKAKGLDVTESRKTFLNRLFSLFYANLMGDLAINPWRVDEKQTEVYLQYLRITGDYNASREQKREAHKALEVFEGVVLNDKVYSYKGNTAQNIFCQRMSALLDTQYKIPLVTPSPVHPAFIPLEWTRRDGKWSGFTGSDEQWKDTVFSVAYDIFAKSVANYLPYSACPHEVSLRRQLNETNDIYVEENSAEWIAKGYKSGTRVIHNAKFVDFIQNQNSMHLKNHEESIHNCEACNSTLKKFATRVHRSVADQIGTAENEAKVSKKALTDNMKLLMETIRSQCEEIVERNMEDIQAPIVIDNKYGLDHKTIIEYVEAYGNAAHRARFGLVTDKERDQFSRWRSLWGRVDRDLYLLLINQENPDVHWYQLPVDYRIKFALAFIEWTKAKKKNSKKKFQPPTLDK